MGKKPIRSKPLDTPGSTRLTAMEIGSYNIEARDEQRFVGDRASKGAFRGILESEAARKRGSDPFGKKCPHFWAVSRPSLA